MRRAQGRRFSGRFAEAVVAGLIDDYLRQSGFLDFGPLSCGFLSGTKRF